MLHPIKFHFLIVKTVYNAETTLKKEVSDLPTRVRTGDSFSHKNLTIRFVFGPAISKFPKVYNRVRFRYVPVVLTAQRIMLSQQDFVKISQKKEADAENRFWRLLWYPASVAT